MTEGRVLVVEDDRGIRDVLAAVLADEGYDVRQAANGREALAVLERWRPDAILLDLMMPVMDGWTFRREQRHRPAVAEVPVIVLSAVRDPRREAQELGAAGVLAKPFALTDVLETVGRILGGSGEPDRDRPG